MSNPRRNVELKARDRDPARSLERCQALEETVDHGLLWQRDTYFVVPNGRLKLREERPGSPLLIQYARPDETSAKTSRYRLVAVDDAGACRAALADALGVRVVVEKERRLFIWRDVRIHLDAVAGLGAFVEFEAVAPAGSDLAPERERVAALTARLGLRGEDLVAEGYADLIAGRSGGTTPLKGPLP
ncbi:class IV adenylate cyclase [Conexibacter sp. JD483]|uniref:class IV adenylate cyclase n=1 Tax=unclassified Conexibacter TaxID=2627773 RepID=UPI002716CD51|nr:MULTISPECIES: class IV adenylate cyclase [unclassified Conexibacter]MDO8185056.1 class IV adenylate cyclase [Conexibacter sp. CPCC 205706]MDO8196766.1 class IV adenylate cyclase [Conexibacter sp. CPCC 205762]MDR9368014.1 class IV adenylate cyclase [Conexibacter sp. JD483]